MDSRRPSASGCELDGHFCPSVHATARLLVVARPLICVDPILVSVDRETSLGQEGQVDIKATWSPVGHRADIPVASVSSGDYDIVGNAPIEHFGLIPFRGDRSKKFHGFGLTQVA